MAGNRKLPAFGPGFLVTAAFIGPGTITTCSLAGASFGFALIYVLVFAVVTTLILQEMSGRLSLAAGKDLSQSLRDLTKHPLGRGIFIALTICAITFGCAAYEAGNIIGGSLGLEIVTSVPRKYWVVVISGLALGLLRKNKYKLIEHSLILLVGVMSLAFFATAIIVKPDLTAVTRGLIPVLPKNAIYLVLALIGTTVVPYNLFLHSSAVRERWKSPVHMRDVRRDLLFSIGLGGFISAAIVITSAAAYYQKGIAILSGDQMAQQLQPLFGPLAYILFGIGFFAAGMSSAITAPYAAAFASSGILGWQGGRYSKKFRAVWLSVILVGCFVSLFNINPIAVIVFAQVANGLILPVASVFLLIVLNDPKKMGSFANNWKQNVIGGLIILLVSLLGVWNIFRLFFQ